MEKNTIEAKTLFDKCHGDIVTNDREVLTLNGAVQIQKDVVRPEIGEIQRTFYVGV